MIQQDLVIGLKIKGEFEIQETFCSGCELAKFTRIPIIGRHRATRIGELRLWRPRTHHQYKSWVSFLFCALQKRLQLFFSQFTSRRKRMKYLHPFNSTMQCFSMRRDTTCWLSEQTTGEQNTTNHEVDEFLTCSLHPCSKRDSRTSKPDTARQRVSRSYL